LKIIIAVSEPDFKRLKDAFKKIAGLNNYITKHAFIKDVLGEGVPIPVAEVITSLKFLN